MVMGKMVLEKFIRLQPFAVVILISLSKLPCALTLSGGAPIAACDTMIPGHSVVPQTGNPPYTVTVGSASLEPGEWTRVRLAGVEGATFKGFLAIGKRKSGEIAGEFEDIPELGQGVACDGRDNSAVTHRSSDVKDVVEMEWIAPEEEGSYVILVTFVQDRSTFWVSVASEEIVVSVEQPDSTVTPDPSTTTSTTTSTSTSTTTTEPPGEELGEIYDGCGISKGCFWFPAPCLETKNCTVITSFANTGDGIRMVLQGKPGFGARAPFIAVGLSEDEKMGADHVIGCRLDTTGGGVVVGEYYNAPGVKDNAAVVREEDLILSPEGAMIDGNLKCTFELPFSYDVEELGSSFDLKSIPYYLLLSSGSMSGGGALACHDVGRSVSLGNISLSDLGLVTSSPSDSTTTGTAPPGEEFPEIYDGCWDTKGCYGFPVGCIDTKSCTVVTSYAVSNGNILFELHSETSGGAIAPFAAVGISSDEHMGADHVIACRFDEDTATVVVGEYCNTKNVGENVAVVREEELIISPSASLVDGFIECTFQLPMIYSLELLETNYDLGNVSYHLLLAAGNPSEKDTLSYHTVGREASPRNISLTSPEPVTPAPTTTTTTSASSTSSTAPPGEEVFEIYEGCGESKGCFGFPENCIDTKTCVVVTSYAKYNENIAFELLGQTKVGAVGGFAAVGISDDEHMSADHVVGCRFDELSATVVVAEYCNTNNAGENVAVVREEELIVSPTASLVDGYIKCSFQLPMIYSLDLIERDYDLEKESYYLLLAAGGLAGEDKLAYHDLGRAPSPANISLVSYEPVTPAPTTTGPTSNTEPPGEEVLEIYNGCGDIKGCYGFPNGCIDTKDCTVVTSYVKSDENIAFELLGLTKPGAAAPFAAVGISDDGNMASDHVIACRYDAEIATAVVEEFCNTNNPGENTAVIRENELIEAPSASMVDGFIKCSFQIPILYSVELIQADYDLGTKEYFLLLAAGSASSREGPALAFHDVGKAPSPEKILLSSNEVVTPGPTTTVAPPSGDLKEVYNGCGSTKGCFGFPSGCISSENCVVVTNYAKSGEVMLIELLGSAGSGETPYAAFGLSGDEKMGSDHVIGCRFDAVDGSVKVGEFYNIIDGSPTNIAVDRSEQLIINPSGAIVDGYIICRFGLPLTYEVTEINASYDLDNTAYRILLAAGRNSATDGLRVHDVGKDVTSTAVLLSSTEILTAKSLVLIKVHGALMIFAWLFCASTGMFLGRYYKHTMMEYTLFGQALWFIFHRICMSLTLLLTLSAFVVIFVEIKGFTKGSGYAAKAHPILGIILTALALLQVAGALFRPHPGDKNRKYFNWFHWTVGNSSYVIGIACIYLANSLTKTNLAKDYNYWLTITGFVVYHVFFHIAITVHTYIVDSKSQDGYGNMNRSLVPGPMKSLKVDEDIKGTPIRLILLVMYLGGALIAAILLTYFITDAIE